MILRRYDFHGVGVAVGSEEPALAEAVDARLRRFATEEEVPGGLEFEFRFVADAGAHLVERPDGAGRPVYDPDDGEVTYYAGEDRLYIEFDDRIRLLCEPARGSALVSALASERASLWLLSRPLLTLPLIELLKRRGLYSLHAAGLAVEGRGVLVAGTAGSGKSTLTLALVRAGLGFLGDDMLFLAHGEDGVRALAFPEEIDVTDETAAWFPELAHLAGRPTRPGWPKHQVRAEETYGGPPPSSCEPAAIVFPRISAADRSTLRSMSRDEALLELAPNVLLTEPRSSQEHLDALGALVRGCDCYRLETGRDFERLAGLLRELAA